MYQKQYCLKYEIKILNFLILKKNDLIINKIIKPKKIYIYN